jgi:hypothetical protein
VKHFIQVTYHGWIERRVYLFDAAKCKHEVTASGHLIIRNSTNIVYSAAPGMWHEVAVVTERMADASMRGMQEVYAS